MKGTRCDSRTEPNQPDYPELPPELTPDFIDLLQIPAMGNQNRIDQGGLRILLAEDFPAIAVLLNPLRTTSIAFDSAGLTCIGFSAASCGSSHRGLRAYCTRKGAITLYHTDNI